MYRTRQIKTTETNKVTYPNWNDSLTKNEVDIKICFEIYCKTWSEIYCKTWLEIYCKTWIEIYCKTWLEIYCKTWIEIYCKTWILIAASNVWGIFYAIICIQRGPSGATMFLSGSPLLRISLVFLFSFLLLKITAMLGCNLYSVSFSGGARGIAARGQIYIGVVEIHLWAKLLPL